MVGLSEGPIIYVLIRFDEKAGRCAMVGRVGPAAGGENLCRGVVPAGVVRAESAEKNGRRLRGV
jgi:hypothetical protein